MEFLILLVPDKLMLRLFQVNYFQNNDLIELGIERTYISIAKK
jgi:hypothetical protein